MLLEKRRVMEKGNLEHGASDKCQLGSQNHPN